LASFQRALAIWEKARGPDHPDVAYALVGMGRTLVHLARPDAALPLLERARAVREKAQGTSDAGLADPLLGLGELYLARRRPDQAAPLFERALALDPVAPDPDTLFGLAEALWQIGADRPRARAVAEQCLAKYERAGHRSGIAAVTRWLAEHPLAR